MQTPTRDTCPAARSLLARHAAAIVLAAAGSAHAAPQDFDLLAQPLDKAIEQVAKSANISVTVDSALVAGKSAPAVKGRMEPQEALRRLLGGTGLAVRVEGTSAVISSGGDKTLQEVVVVDTPVKEGSAEAGYVPKTAETTGPWGRKALLGTPYAINVVSSDLMKNNQMSSPDQLIRLNPLIQLNLPTPLNVRPRYNLRGFSGLSNVLEDGMNNFNGWVSQLEDIERVEVLSGLSGFLYGDRDNRRIYAFAEDLERKWLDRHGAGISMPDRRLTPPAD